MATAFKDSPHEIEILSLSGNFRRLRVTNGMGNLDASIMHRLLKFRFRGNKIAILSVKLIFRL